MIKFGPAGLGSTNEAISNLEQYHKLGLKACEIAFTYGIYIKDKSFANTLAKKTKELDIKLSIHAPYYINLNSEEKQKIENSKKRILDCCRIGHILGVKIIVFHAGFFGKFSKEQTYQNIKSAILEIQEQIKKEKLNIKIAPEVMGKINVFGSPDEILRLTKETNCSFCLDFAHLYARNQGKPSYKEMYEQFKSFDSLHCHFSGIEFTDKGEKNHKLTSNKQIKELLSILPKDKDITIINESPEPVKDSVKSLEIYNKTNH